MIRAHKVKDGFVYVWTNIQLDMVGGWVTCDACGAIMRHTDDIPYCDYMCNMRVMHKKDKATSKRRKK